MPEQIGLEAVFDTRKFDAGIARYLSSIQEAVDITELAASTFESAFAQGIDTAALVKSTSTLTEAVDAFALNAKAASQMAVESFDEIALNAQAASQMTTESFGEAAAGVEAAAKRAGAAVGGLGDAIGAVAGEAAGASEKLGKGVSEPLKKISPELEALERAARGAGAEVVDAGAKIVPATKAMAQSFSPLSGGVNFFREVTVGAFRQVGALITNVVQNALQELGQFTGGLLATAAANTPLVGTLQELKEKMAGVTFVSLQPLFNQLDTLIKKAEPAFLSVLQSAETYLGEVASNAFSWGENITSQLASGMIAALGWVIDALAEIGNLIAYYLMPGSPPRLLPDIDTWGTETANVWLEGWTKADFGIFNEIGNTITGLIRSLPLGKDSEGDVLSRIIGSREGITRAVSELRDAGAISEATIADIVGSVGAASAEVSEYIRSIAGLEKANQDLAAAQAVLNQATKEYDELLKPIDDALASIDESQRQLSEDNRISQLELVANDPNATLQEKAMARLEIEKIMAERKRRALLAEKKAAIDNAQVAVDAATEAQKAAQNAVDENKARIDFLTEQNRLLQEQLRLQEQLEKPAAGGGGGGKPSGLRLPPVGGFGDPFGGALDGLQAKLGGLQAAFSNAWGAIIQTLQPAIEAFGLVRAGWDNLVRAFAESSPRIKAYIADAIAFVVRELGINLPTVFANVGRALNTLAEIWRKHGDTIMAVVNFAWRVIVATVGSAITAVSGLIAIVLNEILGKFDFWSLVFQGKFSEAFASILLSINESMTIAQETLAAMLNAILAIVGTNLSEFTATWQANWDNALLIASTVWENIKTTVGSAIDSASQKIGEVTGAIQVAWDAFWLAAQLTVETTWASVTKSIGDSIDAAKTKLDTVGAAIQTAWETLWGAVLLALETKWSEITGAINDGIQAAKDAVSGAVGDFVSLGGNLIGGVAQGIRDAAGGIAQAAIDAVNAAIAAAKAAAGIQSPSKKTADLIGQPLGEGVGVGLDRTVPMLKRKMQVATGAMLGAGANTVNNTTTTNKTVNFAPVYNGQAPAQQVSFQTLLALNPGG